MVADMSIEACLAEGAEVVRVAHVARKQLCFVVPGGKYLAGVSQPAGKGAQVGPRHGVAVRAASHGVPDGRRHQPGQ